MTLRNGLIAIALILAPGLLVLGRPAACRAEDRVVGIVWEIRFAGRNAKNDVVRRFRATPDGKVWSVAAPRVAHVPKVIGSWEGDAEKTTVKIDQNVGPALAEYRGTFEIVQVGKEPPRWRGTFTNQGGRTRSALIRRIAD